MKYEFQPLYQKNNENDVITMSVWLHNEYEDDLDYLDNKLYKYRDNSIPKEA